VQSENSGVMLPKFRPGSNRTSRHKHTLSVTLGWVYDISFTIHVGPRNKVKKKLMSHLSLVCRLKMAEDCSWMYSDWDKGGGSTRMSGWTST
jgi:hypothetical protein